MWGAASNSSNIMINCSNPINTHVGIYTPKASYGTTAFCVYFLPIVIIFGTTGNAITLVVLSKAATKVTSHFYLWWLALFDMLALISYIPSFWAILILRVYYNYLYGPKNPATWIEYGLMGKGICELRMFLTFTLRTCSTYAIVLVTIERFVLVLFPLKGQQWCTMKSAKIAVGTMVLLSAAINFPWIFAFKMIWKPCFPMGICAANNFLIINRLIEFIILSLVPCLLIFSCNISIIYTLKRRQQLTILVNKKDAKKQEKIITIRLLTVSCVFFILTMPSLIVVSIHTHNELQHDNSHMTGPKADAFILSIVLFAVNLAVNFIIYCFTGHHFRKSVLYILRCDYIAMRKQRRYLINETSNAKNTDQIELANSPSNSARPSIDYGNQKLLVTHH